GLEFSEVRLIYNAQDFTHYVKALHQYRNSDQSWPYLPMGWSNPSFDDKDWIDLPLPTASPGHSDGPFESLHYNSFWYDEYNGYLMRFPIYLSKIASGAEFFFSTVHDDNFALFVNGLMVESLEGWSSTPAGCTWATTATRYEIPSSSFKVGKNVVAVYMQQNYGGAYFDFELTATGVTVGARLQGDVNGDGEVNVQDVTALITYILGTTPPNFNVDNANVNGEGEIDVQDVTALINLILK
ncbi:MAG: dockerin type I repeat-containing protein, partial [Muribaculaceae bacterium]|nr:dockerin type I repeat-containing protein [Muribaculaceae bacterium]